MFYNYNKQAANSAQRTPQNSIMYLEDENDVYFVFGSSNRLKKYAWNHRL